MSIVITGADGQLGRQLVQLWQGRATGVNREACDISDRNAVRDFFQDLHPTVIVNCAAFTSVDRAEAESEACHAVNAQGVAHLGEVCQERDALLVQISTDYVFGGDSTRRVPLVEADAPDPQGVYGRSKLGGERHAARCTRHLIVRTCGLFGHSPQAHNFVATMLRLGVTGTTLRVVDDQQCTPTSAAELSRAVKYLVECRAQGLFHVVNAGQTTWFEFARAIFKLAGVEADVEPITTAAYGAVAPRPKYSVLDTAKYAALQGPTMTTWQQALADYVSQRRG